MRLEIDIDHQLLQVLEEFNALAERLCQHPDGLDNPAYNRFDDLGLMLAQQLLGAYRKTVRIPNELTTAAIDEIEAGQGQRFDRPGDLFGDLWGNPRFMNWDDEWVRPRDDFVAMKAERDDFQRGASVEAAAADESRAHGKVLERHIRDLLQLIARLYRDGK